MNPVRASPAASAVYQRLPDDSKAARRSGLTLLAWWRVSVLNDPSPGGFLSTSSRVLARYALVPLAGVELAGRSDALVPARVNGRCRRQA
ncbi:hypothetical protein [Streptomyces sp. TLI_55]|uniref:hypothetical protein n=1 Tax=Streptomyces sp. TLI_55 TaxID=1938861 RepID=UPI00117CCBB4|nr:hypothetical protein [Streptomyces sp. TLI_55]